MTKSKDLIKISDDRYVNTDDGEIVHIAFPVRQKHIGGFVMLIQEQSKYIAKMNLAGKEHNVLWFLLGVLDYENWIKVPQKDIANELGMQKQHVSRAINNLVKKGILLKGPKSGTSWTYRLDPNLAYKGRAANRKKLISLAEKAKQKGLTILDGGAEE